MNTNQQKVLKYYQSIESRLGYENITGEIKHFGYYPNSQKSITEKKAQMLMTDLVAKNLKLKPGQFVLDAGCGYGIVSCYLAQKYKVNVVGIDLNKYEIGKARKRADELNINEKVQFEIMDYTQLKFPKDKFDAIFTLETLSHSPDLKKTLKGFLNVLEAKGRITLFEYTLAPEKNFNPWELKMLNIGIEGTAALGLPEFKHDLFPQYLKKIGFRNVNEQNITKNMLPSIGRLKRLATIPYFFIKLFRLQKYFVNTTIAVEWYGLWKEGLVRYCIFTAEK